MASPHYKEMKMNLVLIYIFSTALNYQDEWVK